MDVLYLNTPRPYNRYPKGYRPLTGDRGTLRPSTSLGLLSSGNGFDPLNQQFGSQSYSSLVSDRYDYPPVSDDRRSYVLTSPDRLSPSWDSQPAVEYYKVWDPPADSSHHYRNPQLEPPQSLDVHEHSEKFLERLKREKKDLEELRDYSSFTGTYPYHFERAQSMNRTYGENLAPTYEFYDAPETAWRNGSVPLLPKTSSDSRIFSNYEPSAKRFSAMMSSSSNDHRRGFNRSSATRRQPEWRASKGGFFASKQKRDPAWMTNPAPPFDIGGSDEVSHQISTPEDWGRHHFQDVNNPSLAPGFPNRESVQGPNKAQALRRHDANEFITHMRSPEVNYVMESAPPYVESLRRKQRIQDLDRREVLPSTVINDNISLSSLDACAVPLEPVVGNHRVASRRKERSFAIISRPQTPPVTLRNASYGLDRNSFPHADASYPVEDKPQNLVKSNAPSTFYESSESSRIWDRSIESPSHLYDDRNTPDIVSPSHFPPLSDNIQRGNSARSNGILVKGHNGGPRSFKKVVFQCDSIDDNQSPAAGSAAASEAPPHVKAYENALSDVTDRWSVLSKEIGGDVATMVMLHFHVIVTNVFVKFECFQRDKKKTPAPYVKEMLDSAMFYINRILKEFKGCSAPSSGDHAAGGHNQAVGGPAPPPPPPPPPC
ncbi:hypothetical protein ANCCEY_11006 [Ancylostoma ceylanicum]|uniref:CAP N-terminal domain-containing protein n=1 Tax=Ancylostoma ceylanicum TaxID=53326 RepID=A0A0D6LQH2_9BILA|nr:hypothetical protein ANCCEY_11006 [Ancylostoma ceylanicum]